MEEILKFIFELLCYKTGKFISGLLFSRIGVEKSIHKKKILFKDSWKLTYKKKGSKYFYDSTLTLIGLMFWIVVIATVIIISYQKASLTSPQESGSEKRSIRTNV